MMISIFKKNYFPPLTRGGARRAEGLTKSSVKRGLNGMFILVALLLTVNSTLAQNFTHQDTLRGSITPERAWWDLQHYDLEVAVFPSEKSIKGTNTITYTVLEPNDVMQIDLQSPMKLDKAVQSRKELKITSDGNAHYIHLQKKQKQGKKRKETKKYSI